MRLLGVLLGSWLVGCGSRPSEPPTERPAPPLAKRMPDEVMRKLLSPTPAKATALSRDELIKRARAAALAEGYPADRARNVSLRVQGGYYEVDFEIEPMPPGMLGGFGPFVLMDYETGEFVYVHWSQ